VNYLKLLEALIADASAVAGAPVGGTVSIDEAGLGLPDATIVLMGKSYSVDVSALVKRVS
jgi:hypothetical protein